MIQAREPLRFYFSFRSPYSWLAYERAPDAFKGLPIELQYIPVFPPPNYQNDPAAVPNKLKYMGRDLARFAEAYGLKLAWPPKARDCEWQKPHAAYLYARDQSPELGYAFGRDVFRARFSEGQDLSDSSVYAAIAERIGLDPKATVAALDDVALQTRVVAGMIQGATEDSIFGVPLFVYRGEPFWGNDRIDWVVQAIQKAHSSG
jgi:2-hydroxychromene-2-carboxylate isomerase